MEVYSEQLHLHHKKQYYCVPIIIAKMAQFFQSMQLSSTEIGDSHLVHLIYRMIFNAGVYVILYGLYENNATTGVLEMQAYQWFQIVERCENYQHLQGI